MPLLSSRTCAVLLAAALLPLSVFASPMKAARGLVVTATKKKKKKGKAPKAAPAVVAPAKLEVAAPAAVDVPAAVAAPPAPAPIPPPAANETPAAIEEHRPGNEPPVAATPPPSSELNPPLMEKAPVGELPQSVSGETRLDLGLAAGLNTPSGVFGVELEFRPIEWLGLQVGGGTGEWGYRVSPLMRVYPLGRRSFSPFLEAGASFNLGQQTTVGGDAAQPVELLFTPVAVVGLGVRGDLGAHAFITPRVGWGKRLRQDNIRSSDNGRLLDPSGESVNSLEQQEGLLVGLSVGVSFF